MPFDRQRFLNDLEFMAETDQMTFPFPVIEKTVVVPASMTKPMPRQVKGNPRNNNQSRRGGIMIRSGRARFGNTEAARLQLVGRQCRAEHHPVPADRRDKNPPAPAYTVLKNQPGIDLTPHRHIKRDTICRCVLLQSHQPDLGLPAGKLPVSMAKR